MRPDGLNNRDVEKLKAHVETMLRVYTIPVILKKILDVVSDEKSSVADLVEVIQHDQALSSKIVATANTAFYGFRRNISSIPSAAVTLGFNMVRSLAVSVSVFRCASGDLAFLRRIWQHSFETAIVSGLIAERTGVAKKEDAFLAGLIHDLGRAILYQIYGEKYLKATLGVVEDRVTDKEIAAFGATHSQIGAWFVDKYRFPLECVVAVHYHHDPQSAEGSKAARDLASIIHLADYVSLKSSKEDESDEEAEKKLTEVMESVYIDHDGLGEIREQLSEMSDMIQDFYAG